MQTDRSKTATFRLTSAAKLVVAMAVVCVAVGAVVVPATAAEYIWDPNGNDAGTGGSGNWVRTGNFNYFLLGGAYEKWQNINESSAVVVFEGSGTSMTVNIADTAIAARSLIFRSDYELTGNTLGLNGTMSSPSLIQIESGKMATFSMTSVTASALDLTGGGTFVFGRANLFTGAPAIRLDGGTTMNLGTFSQALGGFTLTNGNVNNGTLSATTYTLYSGSVGASLDGSAALQKTGSGTVTLSAVGHYSGSTRIDDGTLALAISSALPSSTNVTVSGGRLSLGNSISQAVGSLSVTGGRVNLGTGSSFSSASATASSFSGSGSYLSGTGSFSSAVTFGSGAHISPASEGTIGTLTTGALTLNGGGIYNWDIGALTGVKGLNWDLVNMSGLTIGATGVGSDKFTLNVSSLAAVPTAGSSYSWAIASLTSGSLSSISNLNSLFLISLPTAWTENVEASRFSITQDATSLYLTMAVPEPRDYAMILGAITLGLVGYRRWPAHGATGLSFPGFLRSAA